MYEKQVFTEKRRQIIDRDNNANVVEQLEKKYGKYCYVPLDIPPLSEHKKITEWYLQNCKPITKLENDVARSKPGIGGYDSIDVYYNISEIKNPFWSQVTDHNFLEEFPHFYQELMDVWPFKSVTHVMFWKSTNVTWAHRDEGDFRDLPNLFRSLIYEENPIPTLWAEQFLPNAEKSIKKYPVHRIPDRPNWAWNNLRVKHASSYDKRFKKILMIINSAKLDYDRYDKLLERSISKYSKYVGISDRSIQEFVTDPYLIDDALADWFKI